MDHLIQWKVAYNRCIKLQCNIIDHRFITKRHVTGASCIDQRTIILPVLPGTGIIILVADQKTDHHFMGISGILAQC